MTNKWLFSLENNEWILPTLVIWSVCTVIFTFKFCHWDPKKISVFRVDRYGSDKQKYNTWMYLFKTEICITRFIHGFDIHCSYFLSDTVLIVTMYLVNIPRLYPMILKVKLKTFDFNSNSVTPVGTRGVKSRMCPPYPHACRKRRLKWGAVI